jgi:2-polyprenyl-6-methoxyphenol hydroxylase-like FAD-dependent oxidoreductase
MIRRRVLQSDRVEILEKTQVINLLVDAAQVIGVKLRCGRDNTNKSDSDFLADLVVDASGRNSLTPKWLESMGYQSPQVTVIQSFLGYASRLYQRPEGFSSDWKGLIVASQPPHHTRGGLLYPIEGDRWLVTLGGIGKDYPPTDEAGFLKFAHSLRSTIIYEAIQTAQPLSQIYSYRRTENRLYHYDKLSKLPSGLILMGDAVCAFNPIYGQGMTTAALGTLTLDKCLHQELHHNSSLKNLTQHFQKQLAKVNYTPWLMATGEDFRWSTTVGGQPDRMTRFMHRYMNQVQQLSVESMNVRFSFSQVAHMIKPPTALFHPAILAQVIQHSLVGV